MDFVLRCNSLKCRAHLTDRAVVTTCSHIFCNACSESLGLSAAPSRNRTCPACHTLLPNPDDAVSTSLNPSDDYKTSVLSGLPPSVIMECAGRALAFWSYQSTQEIVYQEYLAKTLTEKYNNLSRQMDKVINDANSELSVSAQKLQNLEADYNKIRGENAHLVAALREKTRKQQQTQELYDRLKRKQMTAATQSAAFDSVDETFGANPTRQPSAQSKRSYHFQQPSNDQQEPRISPFASNAMLGEVRNADGRVDKVQSTNSARAMGPPPPPRNGLRHDFNDLIHSNPTPSTHRTRLGSAISPPGGTGRATAQNHPGIFNRISPRGLSTLQQPRISPKLGTGPDGYSGYGMSAGIRVGKSQSPNFRPKISAQGPWY